MKLIPNINDFKASAHFCLIVGIYISKIAGMA